MQKKTADVNLWTEFKKYFEAFVIGDIEKSLNGGVEVGTVILTTIGIECLSGYYAGREADGPTFVDFMSEFMPIYANDADDIYKCIRNGLLHDYVIKENPANNKYFILTRDTGEPHLSRASVTPNVSYLNRDTYARDFIAARYLYFSKVESVQTYWDKAMQRLNLQKGFLTVRHFPGSSPSPLFTGTVTKF